MKDRTVLGRTRDVLDITANVRADCRATIRMLNELDREHYERVHDMKECRVRRRRNAIVQRVRRALGNDYANLTYAYLKCKSWRKIGIPRSTFFHRLNKVKIFLKACK